MGNISSMARASTALDSYVAELGNDISYDKSLSSSRFLKTILARHAYGPIVLKIFIKPDATMSLRVIQRRLKTERDALADMTNAMTYQTFVETEKAGYLIRQWAGSNLYDRISTQPYLSPIEKRWIAFQLLTCLRDSRARKVAHGDIKSENVLVQSDLTVLLTDFSSSFKPTFLPLDDPSDFSFFFDTSSRRTCYIAPERFYAADSKVAQDKKTAGESAQESWGKRDGKVTEEMDVFSAGCVLAEMWTDGRTVFNLSELYAYKEGTIGLDGILDNVDDVPVKEMISLMLSRSPSDRPKFDHILSSFRGNIFPEYFYTFLHDYTSSLSELTPSSGSAYMDNAVAQPGNKVDRMRAEWDSISIHLEGTAPQDDPTEVGPALLLLNIVTSNLRNCLWPTSRLHGLKLFIDLVPYLTDEDKVDRIIPFAVELLSDEVAIVRAEACRTIVLVVETIESVSMLNATFIPEYLLPLMRHLASDPDIFVRATYAKGLVRLADAAVNMLEISQAAKSRHPSEASGSVEPDYDSMLQEIQAAVEEQATTLLVDVSSTVKRSMLSSIADLCLFFGRQKSSETVLSHIMTYLNDRDWMLRLAFFDGIVGVGAFIGIKAIEEYVLPLMLQALADSEESVIARVISSLTSLATLGLLPRMRLWDVFFSVKGFLCHPNGWIRQSTAGFIAAAGRNLPPSDTWCILYPAVRTLLHSDIFELDEMSILSAVISPLSRTSLIAAKAAALQNSPAGFWDINSNGLSAKSGLVKSASSSKSVAGQLLKDKGISARDEKKIVAMKEFIVKQAHASRARSAADHDQQVEGDLISGKAVSLTDLGVTPQTVFISPRTVGVDAKADMKRLRPHLTEQTSRRTSFASRSARGVDNPLDEIRKRLASLEPMTPRSDKTSSETGLQQDASPSDSAISSSIDLASVRRSGKKIDVKAAPAVGASYTVALGTASIHIDLLSGRMTPLAEGQSTPKAAPYSSSYEGHDPGVRAFLEQVDLENYREPLLDFGPRITVNQRKRPPRPKTTAPQNVTMIAHLTQHTAPVIAIVPSPDQTFFATASVDSQVLIWDTARLERSVSAKARLTYRMDAPISSMCRIENTHCLAVAAEDGQLHVLRVHVTTGSSARYTKVECIRTWAAERKDGHVVMVSHMRDSSLLLITSHSTIALLDIRTMEITTRFCHPLELGVITATCPSTHWIVLGTDSGSLSLWDLRFGLLLKSWRASGPIVALQQHPSKGRGRWIMVSTKREKEGPIVEVYDIEVGRLVEVYEVRMTRPTLRNPVSTEIDPPMSKEEYIAEILRRQSRPEGEDEASSMSTTPSVISLIVGSGTLSGSNREEESGSLLLPAPETKQSGNNPGWMITAGEDRVVRYWDLGKVSDGFVICGSPREKEVQFKQASGSTPTLIYTLPNPTRQSIDNRHAGAASARQPLRPHYDVISALGTVETPFSSCVISADRSGVVKVWRLEGGR